MHGFYAQFIAQAKLFNGGKEVGLLRGASTRMATWFYALFRLIRQRNALEATIHHAHFRNLQKNERVQKAIGDIGNPVFWRATFALIRGVFPALLALRWCDKSTPCMDKIVTYAHRTEVALQKSCEIFNDTDLFPLEVEDSDLEAEEEHMYGVQSQDGTPDEMMEDIE